MKHWLATGTRALFARSIQSGITCLLLLVPALASFAPASAQTPFVLNLEGRTLSLEPYAPNVLRVTLSTDPLAAKAVPGYGFVAQPAAQGWTHGPDPQGGSSKSGAGGDMEVFRSARMIVRILPQQHSATMPLDPLNLALREPFFGGGGGGNRPQTQHHDAIEISTPEGKPLLDLRSWTMAPESPEVAANDPGVQGYRVAAQFDAPAGEHYYGLGQQQKGWMDLRDHEIHCWHDYSALGGQDVCVPFLVASSGTGLRYGLVWDNPSKTTVDLGFNNRNTWSSEVGNRVSFFVITGSTSDEIYAGYRLLTGVTHMLPRATYGFIQSKAIYPTQGQLLDVAKEYREKHLPLDVMVVDFLNMTRQGELDLDPKRWPDPAAMNAQLHAMGIGSLLSVWPHFAAGTQFYDMLLNKGWLIHTRDGQPDIGGFRPNIGPNLDTTNPEAARWFWQQIRDRYLKPYGFDYLWLDETEPDIDPARDVFAIGSGTRFYNAYPLFHTASVYEGFRRDFGDARRVMILARAAYLGAQRNGTVFWSSDIQSTWDQLKRSIPAGLNFTATGLPYWDTDIAGFFSPSVPDDYHAEHTPLIDPQAAGPDVRAMIGPYVDYPELFVRWFQWGSFQPVMRAHGERMHNEVWSYGKQAETILARYLRLRYQLLPYTYSVAHGSYLTGAPYMRALFMDFPQDPQAANIPDEYMYGPAFLVAPVTEQGATHRLVYLPRGCDWFNFWTNERLHGGQTVDVSAPIDTLPLFVRAGSIVPLGTEVLSASQSQSIAQVRVYPGADSTFPLFTDDGHTYRYEQDGGQTTTLTWHDAQHRLDHTGPAAWTTPDQTVVTVVKAQ